MNFEITGTLIAKFDTQVINDKFKKREFAIETRDESNYSNFVKLQLVQAKCDMIDGYNLGEEVKISFNIRGNKWEKNGVTNYITNLDAWRIQKAGEEQNRATFTQQTNIPPPSPIADAPPSFVPGEAFDNDLPF
jgi:Domain of unknown function (DUF3127)